MDEPPFDPRKEQWSHAATVGCAVLVALLAFSFIAPLIVLFWRWVL